MNPPFPTSSSSPSKPRPWEVEIAARSETGAVREGNEDQYLVVRLGEDAELVASSLRKREVRELTHLPRGWFLAVADGMGGHDRGDVASSLALETVLAELSGLSASDSELRGELTRIVRAGASTVEAAGRERDEARPMGTTLTGCLLLHRRLFVLHAGDSRAYLQRDGELQRLTRDHTLAQALVERGAATEEELRGSPLDHQLFNTLGGGGDDTTEPEIHEHELQPGDRVLLCTDGLTSEVADEEITEILSSALSLDGMADALVELAEERGSPDNVTVVLGLVEPGLD